METTHTEFGILGNGGQADETASFVIGSSVVFRAVDRVYLNDVARVDIANPNEAQRNTPIIAAIGAPALRKEMVDKWPGTEYASVISPHAVIGENVVLSEGCIVAPGAVLTTNIEVGAHAIINVAATVGHNCKFGNYVTVSPGANIGGNVSLGEGVFIGIGATVSNDINIAPGVVVGAGAVVVKDIAQENAVVIGNPAKVLRINEGWMYEI